MEKYGKYIGYALAIFGAIIGVAGWLYNQGASDGSLEGRTFDSPEQKVTVVTKVSEMPTPQEEWKTYYLDSIDTANRISSRLTRDSLMVLEYKSRMATDSINRLNADQLFQIKQEIQQIKNQRN
jgi:hypothetical protein